LPVAGDFLRSFQHLIDLGEVQIAEEWRKHTALAHAFLTGGREDEFEEMHHVRIIDAACHLR